MTQAGRQGRGELGRSGPDATSSVGAPLNGHVLLVDDDALNRDVIARMVRRLGCDVTVAAGGGEAVELARDGAYDLALMDLRMPGMDGQEATCRIRQNESSGRTRLRILALTADSEDDLGPCCLAAGIDGVLTKPVGLAQLRATLQRWLQPTVPAAALPEAGPSTRALADPELIDRSVLDEVAACGGAGGPALLVRVLGYFEELAPGYLATIRAGAERGDADVAWRAAHALKSCASTVGAGALASRGGAVEKRARDAGLVPDAATLHELERSLDDTMSALRSIIGESG